MVVAVTTRKSQLRSPVLQAAMIITTTRGGNAWGGEAGGLPVPAWLLFWVPCPTGTVAGADYGKEKRTTRGGLEGRGVVRGE